MTKWKVVNIYFLLIKVDSECCDNRLIPLLTFTPAVELGFETAGLVKTNTVPFWSIVTIRLSIQS